jgi:eukaryotic-like serine/threonine-protein kinase
MALTSGDRLGSYEVLAPLGQGGMGEVYRARDTTLNRDVALKVLPEGFASDPDRVARFTREAQTLAALNHPNIAAIYGVEGVGSGLPPGETRPRIPLALVMELVEGEDLSQVIARGPMSLADALPIARQIADALEGAHEAGIIHRDLKPANVKVRPDGTVKVLDFGLAKALAPDDARATADAMNSPTLTARATQMGTVLGTAAYMAPEQARGRAVDRRADIWAFGAVLYEMLTGRRAFEGEDVSVTLASVIKDDVKWDALPATLPRPIRRVLRRCLEKDPRRRLSAIGDARLDLAEAEEDPADVPAPWSATPAATRPSLVARLWPALAGVLVTAAVAALLWPRGPASSASGTIRVSLLPPAGSEMFPDSTGVAISPDGTMVAFVVGSLTRGDSELWIRPLVSKVARRLDDAAGATLPFWSPDGRRIAFFTATKLKTIAVTGGRAETVADAPGGRGGIWLASNDIVYAPDPAGPLYRVNATGGTPVAVTTLDTGAKESGHRFPVLLPDDQHFLYASLPATDGKFNVYAASIGGGPRTLVGAFDTTPVYADPGWLLYARQGALAAQPFDARTLKLTGDPIPLEDEPASIMDPTTSFTAGTSVSVSRTGALAYYSSPSVNTAATWYEASGRPLGALPLPPGHYEQCAISPDGTRAVCVRSVSPSESALWLVDLARASAVPLTTTPGRNDSPVWSPDGRAIAFAADREGPQHIYVKTIDETTPDRQLDHSNVLFKAPTDWSPDGRSIQITQLDRDTAQNLYQLPAGGGEMTRLVAGPTIDSDAKVSPDGRWLAYSSDQTGRFEVYVQPVAGSARRVQVSQQGGLLPWWTKDGRALVFPSEDLQSLWHVDVTTGATFRAGTPRQTGRLPPGIIAIAATPDRGRFLAIAPAHTGIGSATLVLNWRAALAAGR